VLRIVDASRRRGPAHARNAGAAAAQGDLLALCDADDVACPRWLEALVTAARDADLVGGPIDYDSLNDPLRRQWRREEQERELPVSHGFLPYVPGGNCAVWASVARQLAWDERFLSGSTDQEFSWRAHLASHRLRFASGAVVKARFRDTLPDLARQWYGYGRSVPLLYRRFARVGMRRSEPREALGGWGWLLKRLPDLWRSPGRRGNWVRVASFRLGHLTGSIRHRVLFL
jgi:glycosyltransferase involved in cell wall biosynthesis